MSDSDISGRRKGDRLQPATVIMSPLAAILLCVVMPVGTSPATALAHVPDPKVITYRMEELWKANDLDEGFLLGDIADAASDAAGNVYLLDRQLADIKVFSPQGSYLETLSRQGEGPGETRAPTGLLLTEKNELGIVQSFPPKIVWLDAAGNPAPVVTALGQAGAEDQPLGPSVGNIRAAAYRAGRLLIAYSQLSLADGNPNETLTVGAYDRGGRLQVTYRCDSRPLARTPNADCDVRPFTGNAWTVDSKGRLYSLEDCGPYRVTVRDSAGRPSFTIERELQRRQRAPTEMEEIENAFRRTEGVRPGREIRVADRAPAIARLRLDAEDRLWVLPDTECRASIDGIAGEFDVFSTEGILVERVRIVGRAGCVGSTWHFLADDRVVITEPVDEQATVTCYALREER